MTDPYQDVIDFASAGAPAPGTKIPQYTIDQASARLASDAAQDKYSDLIEAFPSQPDLSQPPDLPPDSGGVGLPEAYRKTVPDLPYLSDHGARWNKSQWENAGRAADAGLPQADNGNARLVDAIKRSQKAGFDFPNFSTTFDPTGDRTVTIDMENLVATLGKRAAATTDPDERAKIEREKAYWQSEVRTNGMTAEQWKSQTGEPDPDPVVATNQYKALEGTAQAKQALGMLLQPLHENWQQSQPSPETIRDRMIREVKARQPESESFLDTIKRNLSDLPQTAKDVNTLTDIPLIPSITEEQAKDSLGVFKPYLNEGVAGGIVKGTADLVSGMTSAKNVLLLTSFAGAPALVHKLIGLGFAPSLAKGVYEESKTFANETDPLKKTAAATRALGNAAFLAGIASNLRGKAGPTAAFREELGGKPTSTAAPKPPAQPESPQLGSAISPTEAIRELSPDKKQQEQSATESSRLEPPRATGMAQRQLDSPALVGKSRPLYAQGVNPEERALNFLNPSEDAPVPTAIRFEKGEEIPPEIQSNNALSKIETADGGTII